VAEAGEDVQAACTWLCKEQILDVVGDWAVRRPGLRPGGWAFQILPYLEEVPLYQCNNLKTIQTTPTRKMQTAKITARSFESAASGLVRRADAPTSSPVASSRCFFSLDPRLIQWRSKVD